MLIESMDVPQGAGVCQGMSLRAVFMAHRGPMGEIIWDVGSLRPIGAADRRRHELDPANVRG